MNCLLKISLFFGAFLLLTACSNEPSEKEAMHALNEWLDAIQNENFEDYKNCTIIDERYAQECFDCAVTASNVANRIYEQFGIEGIVGYRDPDAFLFRDSSGLIELKKGSRMMIATIPELRELGAERSVFYKDHGKSCISTPLIFGPIVFAYRNGKVVIDIDVTVSDYEEFMDSLRVARDNTELIGNQIEEGNYKSIEWAIHDAFSKIESTTNRVAEEDSLPSSHITGHTGADPAVSDGSDE